MIDARTILADLLARLHTPYLTREDAAAYLSVGVDMGLDLGIDLGPLNNRHSP